MILTQHGDRCSHNELPAKTGVTIGIPAENFRSLTGRFRLERPVVCEVRPGACEVVPASCKTLVRTDERLLKESPWILLSMAKLAETDPLLVTFFFMKELSDAQRRYAADFHSLCLPLQSAWIWRIVRLSVPEIHAREILKIAEKSGAAADSRPAQTGTLPDRNTLSFLAVLSEEGTGNDHCPLQQAVQPGLTGWNSYIEALGRFVKVPPDAAYYCKLPDVMKKPYRVRALGEKNGRHYEIDRVF